jgi:murein DD-endopeptidase MepM/ murein hydrolase activator NlpD
VLSGLTSAQQAITGAVAELVGAQRETTRTLHELAGLVGNLAGVVQALLEAQARIEKRLEVLEGRVDRLEAALIRLAEAQTRTEARLEELAGRVDALARAQARTEQRLEELARAQARTEQRLEELARAQARTEQRLEELARAQARTEQRLEELARAQARTEQRLEELARAQARTEQRLEELARAQARTEQRLEELARAQARLSERLDGEIARREGERYEAAIVRRASRILGPGDGGSPDEPEVRRRLDGALADLSPDPEADPALADIVWWSAAGPILVVEVSLVIHREDIERAAARAQTLRSAGLNALPVVVGRVLPDTLRELAAREGVEYYIEGEGPSAGLIAFRRKSTS